MGEYKATDPDFKGPRQAGLLPVSNDAILRERANGCKGTFQQALTCGQRPGWCQCMRKHFSPDIKGLTWTRP